MTRRSPGLGDCPNGIDYSDVEIDAQPCPYLVLEYADLGSLEDWILKRPDDRPDLNVTELIRGIVRGAAAHRHDIFHRDLKPANVLLTGEIVTGGSRGIPLESPWPPPRMSGTPPGASP